MFRSIVAAALVATVSTSVVAQSYTGQIHSDSYGRYETIVVKPGDNIWKLCKQFQWCRFNYANPTNAAAVNFLAGVAALNGRANMNLIHPGEVIKFPLPYGTAQELDKQDNLRAALNKMAGELAEQNARKDGVIGDLRNQIAELTKQVQYLLGLNTTLTKTVADQKTQIGNLEKNVTTAKAERDARWKTTQLVGLTIGLLGGLLILAIIGAFFWSRRPVNAP